VGASQKEGRVNGAIRNLVELGFQGGIYPVNPKYETVMDRPCYPNLGAIPGGVDLVVVGVPSEKVLSVLQDAHAIGVPAAVVMSSGFAESGEIGRKRQAELRAFIEKSGMLLCGPNCLGIINVRDRVAGYHSTSPKHLVAGDVAVVAQSGTVVVALVRGDMSIGFSYIVSSGNEVGVTSADYLQHFVDDPGSRILCAYLEGINDPVQFVATAENARKARKPIILVRTGRTELGRATSAAHTASLAGSYEVQSALFRQKGIVHCSDLDEWMQAIEMFRFAQPPQAGGLGFVGVSGGENSLVLDHAVEEGIEVPALSETGKAALGKFLPWFGPKTNPIDVAGSSLERVETFRRSLQILAAEPEIGVLMASQDSPAVYDIPSAQAIADEARNSNKCFVFLNNFSRPPDPKVAEILKGAGVPYLQGMAPGIRAIKAFIDYHRRPFAAPTPFNPKAARRRKAREILASQRPMLDECASKQLLGLYGFPVVQEKAATSTEAAISAADELGYPVVAKVLSPDVAHKAIAGGVELLLRSSHEVGAAVERIRSSVAANTPGARIDGILVQPMLTGGIEIILGAKRDPQFGHTLLFGLGGVLVEAIRAFSLKVAPLSEVDAAEMIEEVPALTREALGSNARDRRSGRRDRPQSGYSRSARRPRHRRRRLGRAEARRLTWATTGRLWAAWPIRRDGLSRPDERKKEIRMKAPLPPTRRWFHGRSASLVLASLSAPFLSSASKADDNVVVFAGWGGPIIKSERAYYFNEFEKATGVKVIEVTDINLAKLKTMAETGNAEWDLVQALGLWLPQTVAGGSLWEPINYSAVTTDGIPDALKQKYGVGVQTFAETLAYNTNAFPAGKGPASWADLFDMKKFPGKRGMYNSPRETLEVALMSDGVLPDKLYPLDAERALKRLDQIKGDIVWWDKWPQGANLLASGEYVASMSSHDVIRELVAADSSTPLYQIWNPAPAGVMSTDFLAIPRGAKHNTNAEKLMTWMLDAKNQAAHAKASQIGPSNVKALDLLDAETREGLPTYHFQKGELFPRDDAYWAVNFVPQTERFNLWKLGK
jgi:acyl-CoA synthetase (NDP forming)/spermidine/putrescine-binding protein